MSKGHSEMDHDINSKFKCDHCKTKFAHKHKLKDHKERDHILSSDSRYVFCVSLQTHALGHMKRPNPHVWMQMWLLYNEIHKPCAQVRFQMCLLYKHKLKGRVEKDHYPNSKFKCVQCGINPHTDTNWNITDKRTMFSTGIQKCLLCIKYKHM